MTMESGGGTALARRATVEELVARRNKAIRLYTTAHQALLAANEALAEAGAASNAVNPGETSTNYHLRDSREKITISPLEIEPLDIYMRAVTKMIDTDAWSYVIKITDLERLMDRTEKQKLRAQLMDEPPELTVENVMATLERVLGDADMIFRRGIATCFSNLDRCFKTHDGWKIGSRIILNYAFDSNGWWSHSRGNRDVLNDIERVFHILDGKPKEFTSIAAALDEARRGGWGAKQTEVVNEYFKLNVYKNGNLHIWFRRDDLVEKVNKLIGEYYGSPIPEERAASSDPLKPKTEIAKNFGFYPTPDTAADWFFSNVSLYRSKDEAEPLRILEPEAGTGQLARRCLKGPDPEYSPYHRERQRFDHKVDCVEYQAHLCEALKNEGIYNRVLQGDFLTLDPENTGLYDLVVMNPPFDLERDIDHVMHAWKFLKEDGLLCAIMSSGTEFRSTRKSVAFREFLSKNGGITRDLPEGSFAESGTNVNTIMLKLGKNGRAYW